MEKAWEYEEKAARRLGFRPMFDPENFPRNGWKFVQKPTPREWEQHKMFAIKHPTAGSIFVCKEALEPDDE
jgi:hypothetical protein